MEMRPPPSKRELAVWALLSFLGGLVPAVVDLGAASVQGPMLVLMIVNFALTLPGRAPLFLVAIASWAATPALEIARLHVVNPGMAIALVPALIAAGGGRLFGALLGRAVSELEEPPRSATIEWYRRPLSTRFLLAVSLTGIALAGVPVLRSAVGPLRLRAPATWQVVTWMILTLLGWIALAPMILRERPLVHELEPDGSPGIRPLEFLGHVVVVLALSLIHTAIVLVLSVGLAIPVLDHWQELSPLLFQVFLPLDALAYLAILALGYASDVERHRRSMAQREAALAAETTAARLSALRARLNPHFLFNALNCVGVLARSGRASEAADVVDGTTSLLRYVMDERRQYVPLAEELGFVRRYLEVQRVRFGDRLTFAVESDAEAEASLIPQLLLQPVVENAVEHGVSQKLDGGSVRVQASVGDGGVTIRVTDDGPGPDSSSTAGFGLGLASTRQRLTQLYGSRASLELRQADPTGGTVAVIVVPATP